MAIDNNNNKVLNVPALRFPEFTEDWKSTTIKNACSEFQSGKNIKAEMITCKGLYPVYGGNGLRGFTGSYNHEGDYVLIGRQGALCGNIRKVTGRTYITEHAIAVCASEENDTAFLQYLFQRMKLGQYSDQSAQPGLAVNKLLRLNIKVPSKIEQVKIAKVLSLLDERISTQNKIIEKYESLIQAIIYKAKMDGISKGTWRRIDLCKVLQERNEKNVDGRTICSVSVSQGVVNQIEYLGRSFAAKQTSHYNIVKYGDIVYTKSQTGDFPYGIIKRSDIREDVAVSPLYGVYIPASDSVGVILHFYFMQPSNAFNYLHPLIQKGAKNTINITNGRFLENSVPLPISKSEANTIAGILKTIQAKIEIEKNLLQSYTKEKEYLLRQMFI